MANAAKPDTILGWYRNLVAQKFDGSKARRKIGRPPVDDDIEQLIGAHGEENPSWGYDRIAGALANLGHRVSDQTVGNVLRRHGIPPARRGSARPRGQLSFGRILAVLAGTDFFSVEVFTLRGLVTYYVLSSSTSRARRVDIAGITVHPDERWMQQIARNVTMEEWGVLQNCRYLLHDRDAKYTRSFRAIIESGQVKTLALPAEART